MKLIIRSLFYFALLMTTAIAVHAQDTGVSADASARMSTGEIKKSRHKHEQDHHQAWSAWQSRNARYDG
jgi:hypothetical protein